MNYNQNYENQDNNQDFHDDNQPSPREFAKYLTVVIIIAFMFIIYITKMYKLFMYILTIAIMIQILYFILSITLLNQNSKDVLTKFGAFYKKIFRVISGRFNNYDDAMQDLYKNYVQDNYKMSNIDKINEPSYDPYNSVEQETDNSDIHGYENPGYMKDNYRMIEENLNNILVNKDKLNYTNQDGKYILSENKDNQSEIVLSARTDINNMGNNTYKVTKSGLVSCNHDEDQIATVEKVLDSDITPTLMSQNITLCNNNGELKIYIGDIGNVEDNYLQQIRIEINSQVIFIKLIGAKYLQTIGDMKIHIQI